MPKIIQKATRRNRVQFTVSQPLYNNYLGCMQLAEQLKVTIDFSRDFDRWFSSQLEQAKKDLEEMAGQVAATSGSGVNTDRGNNADN